MVPTNKSIGEQILWVITQNGPIYIKDLYQHLPWLDYSVVRRHVQRLLDSRAVRVNIDWKLVLNLSNE